MIRELAATIGVTLVCVLVGISRATYYRSLRAPKPSKRRRNVRRLSKALRAEILAVLNSDRFMDQPPRQIWAALLDEGRYLCHWRTMYRILRENNQIQCAMSRR
ncbi:MAG: hypothetical protein OXU68_07015 [Bacteroidota bacterium]|nr:hypothetical protein [Bacteroidota bacterium]